MKVQQLYTGCLAEATYFIESNGEAAIIDPLRDIQPYIEMAEKHGAKIKYIFETHFHADFVSGHLDLARKTGATIIYGPTAEPGFEAHVATDGEVFKIGNVEMVTLHTPGHTMESTTWLLKDDEGIDHAIFTGDTLFIGDVGRPDLAVKTDLSREDLANHLFNSLRNKIMPLGDEVIVYPGHGQGSACGKNMSSETVDSLGHQKATNYALRADMTREEFIKEVCDGLMTPPQYFPKNAVMNKMGYESVDEVMKKGTKALNVEEFVQRMKDQKTLVLDTRSTGDYLAGNIDGSISIGIDGNFAPWVGAVIHDLDTPILIVADEGREEEVVIRLSRVGYDNPIGFLSGGMNAWRDAGQPVRSIQTISPEAFEMDWDKSEMVLDVRNPKEYSDGHLKGSQNLPLDYIHGTMADFSKDKTWYVHCLGGYRSVIASSILTNNGFKVINVEGGYKKLKGLNLELETTQPVLA